MCTVIERSTPENLNIKPNQMSDSPFNKMLKKKHPELGVDKMLLIFDENFKEIKKIQGTEDLRLPLGSNTQGRSGFCDLFRIP